MNAPLSHRRRSERGNVFFFIFIGCALFAALSYTVANMMKSGDPAKVAAEKARLYAGEVLDLGRQLREAVQDLRISNSCRVEELSFEAPGLAGYDFSTRDACKVYSPAGGSLSYYPPAQDWLEGSMASASTLFGHIYFPGDVCVQGVGEGGASCDANGADLLVIVPFLKPEVCNQINKSLGLPETPAVETGSAWSSTPVKFRGSFSGGTVLNQNGIAAACFEGSGSNDPPAKSYHFVQVLLAR